jgi:hypothetical protein
VFKLVIVIADDALLEWVALVVGEIVDPLVAEAEEDKLNNDVAVTDDETDDVLVILTKADEDFNDERVAVAERLSIKPEEVTDWLDDPHEDSFILKEFVDDDVCIDDADAGIVAEPVIVDEGESVRLLVAVKVTKEVSDSLLDSVNNADNDIVVVAHDVNDALLDDVA